MTIGIRTSALKLICEADGLEIDLVPLQGLWTEEQYLRLTDQTNRFMEFTEGHVEVLPMPTRQHQAISRVLFLAFLAFIQHWCQGEAPKGACTEGSRYRATPTHRG